MFAQFGGITMENEILKQQIIELLSNCDDKQLLYIIHQFLIDLAQSIA